MKRGQLLLLPNLLSKEADHSLFLPSSVDRGVVKLDGLIAESEKEGRAYLKRFNFPGKKTFRDVRIERFNKHTREVDRLLSPLKEGEVWGLISDAGLPILADPGFQLVRRAHDFGIRVKAFIGPSSLVLALMLSGLVSQRFAFHGYLPKEGTKRLKELEARSLKEKATQVFIEAPFRNRKMLKMLLETLSDETLLCLAWDLTLPTQGVETHRIKAWRKRTLPDIGRRPTVFLFHTPDYINSDATLS